MYWFFVNKKINKVLMFVCWLILYSVVIFDELKFDKILKIKN